MAHMLAPASLRVRRPRGVACFLAVSLLLAFPASGHAQAWMVQGAWVDGHVAGGLFGAEGRYLLGLPPALPGSSPGPIEVTTRNWMLTGMVGAGVNVNPAGSARVRPAFYVHAGVLRRTGSDMLTRVGVVGAAYIKAEAVGPAVLLEFAGVADLKVGVLHTSTGWRPNVSLAVGLAILSDLSRQ